ncbi:hypothetical protein DFJ73DRAFT_284128 [Zopfochytrium polystomum]|nr:hypothetical protein DFJ73DRAFT_284128 [Zopfochytrium polystomum]
MQQQQQQPQRRLSHHLPSRPPSAAAGTPARPRPAPSPLAPTPPKTVPAKRPLAPSQTVDRDPKRRPASDTLLKGHSDDALSSSLALLKSRPDGKPSASATLPKSLKQLLQGQPSAGRPPQISPLNQLRSSPSSSHASAMAPSPTLKVRKHDAWSHYVAEPKSLTSDPPRPQQQQQGLTRRLGSSPIVLSDDGPASPIHASALASEPPVALPSSERRPVTSVLDDGSGSAARNGPIGTNPVVVRERSRSLSPMELSDGEEVASLIEANPPPKPSAAMGSRPAEDVVSACSIKEEEEAERPKDPAATQSNPLLPLHRTPAVEQPLLPVTKDGAPAVWTDAHHILETILVSRITRSLGVLLSAWCEIRATKTPEGYGVKQLAVSLFRGFVDQSSFASVCSKDEQLVLSTVTSILLRHYLRFHRNNYTTSPPWWILDINSLPVSNFALCKSSDAEGRGLTLDTVLAEVYSNINSIRPKCSIVEDSKFEEWESAWCVLASLQCFSVADIVALGLDKPGIVGASHVSVPIQLPFPLVIFRHFPLL